MKKSDNSFSENNCDYILLKSRSQYLDILNAIRKDTEKIIIVQIDGEDKEDPIVNAAKKNDDA
jgi:outer membrane protein assembly factor BamE (lipoprotein component of BamABCDE complex)